MTVGDIKKYLATIDDDVKVYKWHDTLPYDSVEEIFDYQEHEYGDFSEAVLYV